MSTHLSLGRRSSTAEFELIVDGHSYDVAQVAPEFLILDTAMEIPAGPAELVIRLDGRENRRQITLVDGADGISTRIRIRRD